MGEDSESDSWSDDSESEKLSKSWDAASEDSAQSSSFEPDGLWPAKDRIGELYLQYVEYLPPYGRIPLMEKVRVITCLFTSNYVVSIHRQYVLHMF